MGCERFQLSTLLVAVLSSAAWFSCGIFSEVLSLCRCSLTCSRNLCPDPRRRHDVEPAVVVVVSAAAAAAVALCCFRLLPSPRCQPPRPRPSWRREGPPTPLSSTGFRRPSSSPSRRFRLRAPQPQALLRPPLRRCVHVHVCKQQPNPPPTLLFLHTPSFVFVAIPPPSPLQHPSRRATLERALSLFFFFFRSAWLASFLDLAWPCESSDGGCTNGARNKSFFFL